MSSWDYCIFCKEGSDLVCVHDYLSLEGYICSPNNAAALVDHCFNIKIVTSEKYAICSMCVSKLIESCILKDQLVYNVNSIQDNKDIINVKHEYSMDGGILAQPFKLSDCEMKEKYTAITKKEFVHQFEDVYSSENSLDDPSYMYDSEKSSEQISQNEAVENNLNKQIKTCLRSYSEKKTQERTGQILNQKNNKNNVGIKVNVEIKDYFTETPVEISKSFDDKVKIKSVSKTLKEEFESLLINCKDFGLFSWYRSKYKCLVCNEVFANKNDFKVHTLKHGTGDFEKFFPNGECGLKVDISSMKCRHCGEGVRELETFRRHLSVSHSIQADDLLRRILPFNLSEPKVRCGVCNKDFVCMSTLNVHMNEHSTNYICPHCGKFFFAYNRLRGHMNKLHVTGTFKCTKCDETFESLRRRNCHMTNVHRRRRFLCQHCPETFTTPGDRLRHLAEAHNEELRKYKCETCPATYMTAKDLNRHVRSKHIQERNYPCSVCGYCSFDRGTLKEHMVMHTGEKEFECQICHKKFARRGNLSQHLRVHRK